MQKIALIPAYEPDNKLISLVKELNQEKYIVIVVDDGSGNNYKDIFKKLKAKVISYEQNQGKGYALKKGLKYIQGNYKKGIIITLDADGQHKVEDANKLCQYIKQHPCELALGSRYRNNGTPLRSKIGNYITMHVFKLVTGEKIYDTQTGLRAFSIDLIPYLLEIHGNRYEYEMNVLLNLNRNKIKAKEIPIEAIYFNKNKLSHFKTIRDSYLIYKEILNYKTQKHYITIRKE